MKAMGGPLNVEDGSVEERMGGRIVSRSNKASKSRPRSGQGPCLEVSVLEEGGRAAQCLDDALQLGGGSYVVGEGALRRNVPRKIT